MFQGLDVIDSVARICGLRNREEKGGAMIVDGSFSPVCCVTERGRGFYAEMQRPGPSTLPG